MARSRRKSQAARTSRRVARRSRRRAEVRFTRSPGTVVFEAVLRAESRRSLFAEDTALTAQNLGDFQPSRGQGVRAARILEQIGFKVRHIGTFSLSGEGPAELWTKTFRTQLEERREPLSKAHPQLGVVRYFSHVARAPFTVPPQLDNLVERAYPQRPPAFYSESPLPPRVGYHHLRVPADVATVTRAVRAHKLKITGAGVLVAMTDTGFYKHPFYAWHGYNFNATLSPDAIEVEKDDVGHGTAEAANIFANAPDVDFIGIKMGANPTLAFKTAADLYPAVITNSWGYDIQNAPLPNFLKPLEAAVIEAVRDRGIVVCFSAGNGHFGFPGQMPEVISAGGVYANEMIDDTLAERDFDLSASNYASSFDSQIYPGRHVPDVCGLVGETPRGVYIMLPVQPGDDIDTGLAGGAFPNGDETQPDDGWAVISGTSAASPQIAGVCALIKQLQPGLPPDMVKAILRSSARDVNKGHSAMGQPSGPGHDGATGAGLVDALAAVRLARSATPRNLSALPAPR
jgi:serine protease AprX